MTLKWTPLRFRLDIRNVAKIRGRLSGLVLIDQADLSQGVTSQGTFCHVVVVIAYLSQFQNFFGTQGKFSGTTHFQGVLTVGIVYLKKIHERDENITQGKVYS